MKESEMKKKKYIKPELKLKKLVALMYTETSSQ